MKKYNIVFFGSAEFGIPTLEKLAEVGHNIVAVVTTPDKPSGRGLKLRPTPVNKYALEKGYKILTPTKFKDENFLQELHKLNADLFIVVAFKKLPRKVWEIPPLGTINLHASLLPQYRGAAPLNWAIINGEEITGLTTFFINDKIDEGNILLQYPFCIPEDFTAGDLHDALMIKGADLVATTLYALGNENIIPQKQQETGNIKKAPKIYFETCLIDWEDSTTNVYNKIRGLSPYPGAFSYYGNKIMKIYKTQKVKDAEGFPDRNPGEIYYKDKQMFVKTQDGWLEILKLQLAGKKALTVKEFLNGLKQKIYKFTTLPQKNKNA